MSELLRPCPFCGGLAHMVSDYCPGSSATRFRIWHECPSGGDDGYLLGRMHIATEWFDNPDRCVQAWNNRWER